MHILLLGVVFPILIHMSVVGHGNVGNELLHCKDVSVIIIIITLGNNTKM